MYVHTVAEIQIKHQNYTITTKLMRMQDKFSKCSHLAPMQNDILICSQLFLHDFPQLRLWWLSGKIERLLLFFSHIADARKGEERRVGKKQLLLAFDSGMPYFQNSKCPEFVCSSLDGIICILL